MLEVNLTYLYSKLRRFFSYHGYRIELALQDKWIFKTMAVQMCTIGKINFRMNKCIILAD